MASTDFPYGNDPYALDLWAGSSTAKSSKWLAAYHSGVAAGLGAHAILFFGTENLVAIVAHLIGIGVQFKRGAPLPGGTSKAIKDIIQQAEKSKKAYSAAKDFSDLNNLRSAESIYRAISVAPASITTTLPFCAEDLHQAAGTIWGVGAESTIAASSVYNIEAFPYFTNKYITNISKTSSTVSVSIGGILAIWLVDRTYSLWGERAFSSTNEYPFRGYNVDPLFQKYRNPIPARLRMENLQDAVVKGGSEYITQMKAIEPPLPASQMLGIINKADNDVSDFLRLLKAGEDVSGHRLMKYIPSNMHKMFPSKPLD